MRRWSSSLAFTADFSVRRVLPIVYCETFVYSVDYVSITTNQSWLVSGWLENVQINGASAVTNGTFNGSETVPVLRKNLIISIRSTDASVVNLLRRPGSEHEIVK